MTSLLYLLTSVAWAAKQKAIMLPAVETSDGSQYGIPIKDINELKSVVYGAVLFFVLKEVYGILKSTFFKKADKLDHIEKLLIQHIAQNDERLDHLEGTVSEIKTDIKDLEARL